MRQLRKISSIITLYFFYEKDKIPGEEWKLDTKKQILIIRYGAENFLLSFIKLGKKVQIYMKKEKRSAASLMKRYIFLCIGLCIMAFGVAFSIEANLGTSPISSLPYVSSLLTPLSVGNTTILMHCVFILIQILILRKRYELIQLIQLPVAFIFGYLTDFAVWALDKVTYHTYWQQWMLSIVGILLVAVGVSFEVTANVVTLAGEGVVLAICKVCPVKFGYMKVGFDVTLVVISCILSLAFLSGLHGVREGTIAAAIFVGLIAKEINRSLKKFEEKFLY